MLRVSLRRRREVEPVGSVVVRRRGLRSGASSNWTRTAGGWALLCLTSLLLACAVQPSPSGKPDQFMNASDGTSGTLRDLFGGDWSVAVVSYCLESSGRLPDIVPNGGCVDYDVSGPYVALFDTSGTLVRYYADTFRGSVVQGCYSPGAVWISSAVGLSLERGGEVACPA